eukprot:2194079-Amphidinium_carterae.2
MESPNAGNFEHDPMLVMMIMAIQPSLLSCCIDLYLVWGRARNASYCSLSFKLCLYWYHFPGTKYLLLICPAAKQILVNCGTGAQIARPCQMPESVTLTTLPKVQRMSMRRSDQVDGRAKEVLAILCCVEVLGLALQTESSESSHHGRFSSICPAMQSKGTLTSLFTLLARQSSLELAPDITGDKLFLSDKEQ